MFRYSKTIRRFKAGCDEFPMPGGTQEKKAAATGTYAARPFKAAVRTAACAMLAVALILTGTTALPLLQNRQSGTSKAGSAAVKTSSQAMRHGFTLEAYAASPLSNLSDASSDEGDSAVQVGKLDYSGGGDSQFESEFFLSIGSTPASVTYSAANGQIDYSLSETWNNFRKAFYDAIVCNIEVPSSEIDISDAQNSFQKLWDNGTLNDYRSKYFGGKELDLTRYEVNVASLDVNNHETDAEFGGNGNLYMDDSLIVDKPAPGTDVITIADENAPGFRDSPEMKGQTVTVSGSDLGGYCSWQFSDSGWDAVRAADKVRESTGVTDYSKVPGDTVHVKVTYIGGQTETEIYTLYFDKAGNLLAKLQED